MLTTLNIPAALRDAQTSLEKLQECLTAISQVLGSGPAEASKAVPAGRKTRSTREDVEKNLVAVVEVLRGYPDGLRSEELKRELPDLDKRDMANAVKLGIESDQVVQSGQKRATRYSLHVPPSKAQREGRVKRGRKPA